MKITKKIEEEILEVMEDYWGSYLRGDFDTWASYLPDNYGNIGTTKEEIWNNKKEIMDYTHRISEQVTGTAEIRNKVTQFIPYDPYIMIHELGDMFVKAEEEGWIYYAQVRLSSLLEKTKNEWKILHQHGSYPDSKADTGEAYGFDELKIENKNLKDAIQRRTMELEHKNRDLEIEAALEKVRSRTMAMHKAEELKEVVTVVVEKLKDLGVILDANGAILCTYFPDSRDVLHWIASPNFNFLGSYLLPYFDHPIFKATWESRLSGDEYFSQLFTVEEKNSFYKYAFEHSDYKYFPEDFKEWVFQNDKHSLSFAWAENSAILIPSHTGVLPSDSDVEILKRFAKVFEQAYIRFMDMQKAENAAKETKIQLSLEKIRAQVTGMQESSELLDIMVSIRKEFVSLGHDSLYFWYMRWLPDIYEKAMTSIDGTRIGMVLKLPRHIHGDIPLLDEWEKSKRPTVVYAMGPEAAIDYVHKMINLGDFEIIDPNAPSDDDIRHIGGITFIMARTSHGEIGYSLPGVVSDPPQEAVDNLVRLASVFDLAYRRFEDLKESERQKKEAEIELALERVRGKAMSMQHSDQLYEVVSELRNQMGILGQKELEFCMINFYDKDDDYFESWGAIPTVDGEDKYFQGRARYPKKGIKIVEEMMSCYTNEEKEYTVINEKEKAIEWFEMMEKYSPEAYKAIMQFSKNKKGFGPPKAYWTFADFDGGSLGMVTYDLPDETSRVLLGRAASAFGIAFTRFQDLQVKELQAKRLHEEKQRLEKTLNELKATQAQLIQSEKMASLGELTAGIAHEIQNPLNFVNNFSQINKELIEEALEELENGDLEEAKSIFKDVHSNEDKINYHGNRADSIVKGMLLHSKSNKGEKAPTDINALCDEFLRLSYHGLRAKDRSFNADFETDFDKTIPKIEVVPQDIGRVLLNLINNAFQAVSSKPLTGLEEGEGGIESLSTLEENKIKKTALSGVVKVRTKNLGDKIQITVSDNGPGIPDDIKEKIFQPFFTTKPTGQGTGLGLSLAYDIVKAHGGELRVETKDGEGSVFKIILPI